MLLDQDMPGMSGVTLLRKLRCSPDFYDLPVIMFTSMNGAQDEAQAIYAGAQDFIRKPFDPLGLTSRIQRVLSKRSERPKHTDLKTHLAQSSGMLDTSPEAPRRFI
jgi:DNA-binding response OmpR family regulator